MGVGLAGVLLLVGCVAKNRVAWAHTVDRSTLKAKYKGEPLGRFPTKVLLLAQAQLVWII